MTLFDPRDDERRGQTVAPLLVVRLAGDPHGKGRPRFVVMPGGYTRAYTPPETQEYEDALRAAAIDAMAGRPLLEGPLAVIVFAYMRVPESWSDREKDKAVTHLIRPTVKPDWENIGKTLDAFNPYIDKRTGIKVPVVWRDDTDVVDGRVVKLYARRQPGIIVEVREAGPPPEPWSELSPQSPVPPSQ